MKLESVEIAGYRSVREQLELSIDPSVTILLGANDQGKTNILDALNHLNTDAPFVNDDLNWDMEGQEEAFPQAAYIFRLSVEDKQAISQRWDAKAGQQSEEERERIDGVLATDEVMLQAVSRAGIGNELEFPAVGSNDFDEIVASFLRENLPRVELVHAYESLVDTVNAAQIAEDENEFMQGIFYAAGLDPFKSDDLFMQNNRTSRRLTDANDVLNENLRARWAQGRSADLNFRLEHRSGDQIHLLVEDPAVDTMYVRASARSSGFTQFFATTMVLYARRAKHSAASHLFVFDEPGLFLHPSGQMDYLQVLEGVSQTSQVVYATHSTFMANRNFPSRHRLVEKDTRGTRLSDSLYSGNWGGMLDAMGLSLPGSSLFANRVLLTQRPADPIYVQALLQWFIENGLSDFDINGFTVVCAPDALDGRVLAESFVGERHSAKIAVLVDGSETGERMLRRLSPYLEEAHIPARTLNASTTLEDHLPFVGTLYVQALARSYYKTGVDNHMLDDTNLEEVTQKVRENFETTFPNSEITHGIADWAAKVGNELYPDDIEVGPSRIGIAQEYVRLLRRVRRDETASANLYRRARDLAEWIVDAIVLPSRYPMERAVSNE